MLMNTRTQAIVAAVFLLAFVPPTSGQQPAAPQPRINALIVSGGCCHDYSGEARVLMDAVGRVLPVDWTAVVQGGTGTRGSMPVYAAADWAKRFDIVVHNECLADVDDPAYIRKITAA